MTNMMPDSGKMKLRCFLSRPQYLWPKYTAATITTARMPARDPERIMDRVIIAERQAKRRQEGNDPFTFPHDCQTKGKTC